MVCPLPNPARHDNQLTKKTIADNGAHIRSAAGIANPIDLVPAQQRAQQVEILHRLLGIDVPAQFARARLTVLGELGRYINTAETAAARSKASRRTHSVPA